MNRPRARRLIASEKKKDALQLEIDPVVQVE